MQACSETTRGLLFPVFLDPGFPALAGGRVAAAKSERSDVGIGDFLAISGIFGKTRTNEVLQRRTSDAIEDVAFENRAIFARQGYVTAVIECFFKRLAEFVFGSELGNPAFDSFHAGGQERLPIDLDRICPRPAPRADSCGSECSCASFFHLRFGRFNLDERVEGVDGFNWLVQEGDGVGIGVRCVEHGLYGSARGRQGR